MNEKNNSYYDFLEDELVEEAEKEPLAKRTLPGWASYEPESKMITANKLIKERTKFGPLLAPLSVEMKSNKIFLLKVFLPNSTSLWVDHSDENKCCWLSLIAPCKHSYNLYASQIGESLYYVAMMDIACGSQLKVWYAPLYKRRLDAAINPKADILLSPISIYGEGKNPYPEEAKKSFLNIQTFSSEDEARVVHSIDSYGLDSPTLSSMYYSTIPPYLSSFGASLERNIASSQDEGSINKSYASKSSAFDFHKDGSKGFMELDNEDAILEEPDADGTDQLVETHFQKSPEEASLKDLKKICSSKEEIVFMFNSFSKAYSLKGSKISSIPSKNSADCVSIKVFTTNSGTSSQCQNVGSNDVQINNEEEASSSTNCPSQEEPEGRKISCKQCRHNFPTEVSLASHLKEHLLFVLKKIIFCKECKIFISNSNYSHIQTHLNNQKESNNVVPVPAQKGSAGISPQKKSIWSLPPPDALSYLNTSWKEEPYDCQICLRKFDKAQYLLRHLSKHLADFSCNICKKAFARKASLLKHNDQVHSKDEGDQTGIDNFKLTCDKCNIDFSQIMHYKAHCLKHEGPIKCKKCGIFTSSSPSMARHIKNCIKKSIKNKKILPYVQKAKYQCEFCKQKYSLKSSFDDHTLLCKQLSYIEEKGEASCLKCGHLCKSAAEFRLHYQSHTHPYSCLVCFHKFKSRGNYELHICSGKFVCDKCKSIFNSIQGLNRHLSIHEPPSFSCPTCQHPFYRKDSLARHKCKVQINVTKVRKKDFVCLKCLSHFYSKYNLEKHLSSVHGVGSRQFVCQTCGKKFHRSDLLKDHEKTHLRPLFCCPKCHKEFKSKAALRVHSTIHREDFRFLCRYCSKGFSQKTNLIRHEKSHAPVGSVKCQHCGIRCRSTQHLERHLLSHTDVHLPGTLKKRHHTLVNVGGLVGGKQMLPAVPKQLEVPLAFPIDKLAPFHLSDVSEADVFQQSTSSSQIIHKIELNEPPPTTAVFLASLSLPPIAQTERDAANAAYGGGTIDLKVVSSD